MTTAPTEETTAQATAPGRRNRRPWRRRLPLTGAAVLAVVALVGTLLAVTRPSGWADGTTHGRWLAMFDGFGQTTGNDAQVRVSPRPPTTDARSDTHAALVASRQSYGDLVVTARLRTLAQLRPHQPNPWEVGWLLWHVTDRKHFYAIALKPTGWELSKQVPGSRGGQEFLATGSTPTFALGRWHTVSVIQAGPLIVVSADGQPLVRFRDTDHPYTHGRVGLYSEDAIVEFRDVHAEELPAGVSDHQP